MNISTDTSTCKTEERTERSRTRHPREDAIIMREGGKGTGYYYYLLIVINYYYY